MSELRPRSELRSRSVDRTDPKQKPEVEGLARHGRLKKPGPWGSIAKIVAASLAVVLVSGAAVGAVAFDSIYGQRDTVSLVGETDGPPPQIGSFEGGFNILIAGSDTRAGQSGIGGSADSDSGELNDVNMILHVAADRQSAVAISFPRDMVMGIPECPSTDGEYTKYYSTEPLNTALSYGGLACVALTLSEFTGLDIQFAGLITFTGVIEMTNAIGGVPVCIDGPLIDPEADINLPEAGTYTLKGEEALGFLRSRHGVGDGSDLTRISSQQVYLSSMVRTLKSSDTLGDYKKLYNLADAAIANMQLSNSLADVPTMVSIALALKDIPLERVQFVQYPGTTGGFGVYEGKVQPNEYLGEQMMDLVRADTPFTTADDTDGTGATIDPNAPEPEATDDAADGATGEPTDASTATPEEDIDVIDVRGQSAATYSCSITNSY
ncbi:LytR family transcriptional regulator [Salinibacterium sp. UTAS2018]|uniref:LCP family protein n=1 Tax=Salinibacterium sp. UTAS2018 TaxID=2508880 RepID=UPI0010095959|nr:LCP family protein [Salinibacterium sp. UTAS2018]QAV70900.1 LytR family transcriptional regulator [Salinibacterium sp. UTAS2018]